MLLRWELQSNVLKRNAARVYDTMSDYSNINEYTEYIKNNGEPGNNILPGFFYSFKYDYRNIATLDLVSDISSYDGMPLIYAYDIDKNTGKLKGYNLHFLPPEYRMQWVLFLKRAFVKSFENNQRITLPPQLVTSIDKKANFACRQYDINKIRNIKLIPNDKIFELLKYVPRTLDSKQPDAIFQQFKRYIP